MLVARPKQFIIAGTATEMPIPPAEKEVTNEELEELATAFRGPLLVDENSADPDLFGEPAAKRRGKPVKKNGAMQMPNPTPAAVPVKNRFEAINEAPKTEVSERKVEQCEIVIKRVG